MTNLEKKFIKETDTIKDRLIVLGQQSEITYVNKIEISDLWMKFSNLWKNVKKGNFDKKKRIKNQYKKLVQLFKKFENTIRVFKELPND